MTMRIEGLSVGAAIMAILFMLLQLALAMAIPVLIVFALLRYLGAC